MRSGSRSSYDAFHFDKEGRALAVALNVYFPKVHPWKTADANKRMCQDEFLDMLDKMQFPVHVLNNADVALCTQNGAPGEIVHEAPTCLFLL